MSRQQRVLFLVTFALLVVVYSSFAFIIGRTSNSSFDAMPTLVAGNFESVIATPVPDIITVASSNTLNQSEQTTISNRVDALLPSSAFIAGDRPAPVTSAPVPNQQVLTFAPYTSPMEQESYLQSIGATVIQRIDSLNTVIVQVERPIIPDRTSEMRLLVTSEPDYFLNAQISDTPNDPLFADQWALPASSIPQAWSQLPNDATSITVAVIDSGVCAFHSDLAGRILTGMSFVTNDASVEDTFGHGCAITGAIAANIDNAAGIAGVAPNTQILPLRVLDGRGIGTYSAVAAAIVYATDHGAQIINLSLGGGSASNLLESAVEYATSRGVTVIAAAGNQGSSRILYPAAYPSVIAVGAIERDLSVSNFSNYGAAVDVYAPGRDIVTLGLNDTTITASGTSIATAIATGVAALEKTFGRELALGGVLSFNRTTVVDITEPNDINLVTIAPEVREAIERDGNAQVIIALNMPINAQDDTARAQAVAAAQTEVLAQLAPEEFTLAHQFIYTPGMAGTINAEGLAALTLNSQIANIYLDEPMEAAGTRSVNNIGVPSLQTGGVNGLNLTGLGVTVAVLDSGISMSNPAVSDSVVAQQCFSSKNRCPGESARADIAPDESLHGTNVSAIITDPQGVAPDAKIAALKVLDKFGTGTSSDWIAALDWIKNETLNGGTQVDVVNMSLGSLKLYKANSGSGATNCDSFYPLEAIAVRDVVNLGIPIVAATGNQGSKDSINSPACITGVIAVGAIYDTSMGAQPPTGTYYSQFLGNWPQCADTNTTAGQVTCFSNSSAWVDVVAPGADIVIGQTGASGTSQASPHVAGVVALMKQADPTVAVSRVTAVLRNTGDTIVDAANGLNFRSLDAFEALYLLLNPGQFTGCSTAVGMPEEQCNALVALYDTSNGINWTSNLGWKQVNTPCTWFGVTCDVQNNVTGLALSNNNLSGGLSTAFFGLPYLQQLSLNNNFLNTTFPTEIGTLLQLQELYLSGAGLNGNLPSSIGNLTQLKTLDLTSNSLGGALPASIGNLTQLENLLLRNNAFTGAIPASFNNLTRLKIFRMENANLNAPLPNLGGLIALEELSLVNSNITGTLATWMGFLPNLKTLDLSSNSLIGTFNQSLWCSPKIEKLYLQNNFLSGNWQRAGCSTGSIVIGPTLSPFKEINISNNQFSGNTSGLEVYTQLQSINMARNAFGGGVANIPVVPSLIYLDVSRNAFGGLPFGFNTMTALQYAYLYKNNTSSFMINLSGMNNLRVIDLRYRDIQAVNGLPLVANVTDMPIIDMRYNLWTGTINGGLLGNPLYVQPLLQDPAPTTLTFTAETGTDDSSLLIASNDITNSSLTEVLVAPNDTSVGFVGAYISLGTLDKFTQPSNDSYLITGVKPGIVYNVKLNGYTVNTDPYGEIGRFISSTGTVNNIQAGGTNTDITNVSCAGVTGPVVVVTEECPALKALYQSLGGTSWTNSTNWFSTPNVCTWYGITCASSRVSIISLENNNLRGSIPGDIRRISLLNTLDLSGNNISGAIPKEFVETSWSLQTLDLSFNQLTGTIPGFKNGTNSSLRTLDLSHNQLTGEIPDTMLFAMGYRILRLNNNQLIGDFSSYSANTLSNMSQGNLVELDISNNQLTGPIDPSFYAVYNLEIFNVSNNLFSGEFPFAPIVSTGFLQNLVELNLSGNQFSGVLHPNIGNLINLEKLDLGDNDFTGALPSTLGSLTNLTELNVNLNQFTGAVPSTLGSITPLQTLNLSSNQFTSLPTTIGTLTNLQTLDLANNQLTSLPTEIGSLSTLQNLLLGGNNLTSLPATIGNLSNLHTLDLGGNELTALPSSIGSLSALQYLRVDWNNLTALPSELANLSQLNYLNIGGNQLTGTLPSWINATSFPNLTQIFFAINKINDIPVEFTNFSTTFVELYGNLFNITNPTVIAWLDANVLNWRSYQLSQSPKPHIESITAAGTTLAWASSTSNNELACSNVSGGPYVLVVSLPSNSPYEVRHTLQNLDSNQDLFCATRSRIDAGYDSLVVAYSPYSPELQVNARPFGVEIPVEVIPSVFEVDVPDPTTPENLDNVCTEATGRTVTFGGSGRTVTFGGSGRTVSFGGSGRTVTFGGSGEPTELRASTAGSSYDTVLSIWRVPAAPVGEPATEFSDANAEFMGCSDNSDREGEPGDINGIERPPGSPSYTSYLEVPFDRNFDLYFVVYSNNDESGNLVFSLDADIVTDITSVPLAEAEALSDIYQALGGNNWTNHTGWFENAEICTWYGVTCTLSGQSLTLEAQAANNITGLSLPNNNLRGKLPPEISNLTELQMLDISDNRVRGAIPVTMATLASLSNLNINHNALFSTDAALTTFLNTVSPNWQNTQTVAPSNIVVGTPTADGFGLTFDPIAFSSGIGFYEAGCSLVAGGPYVVNNRTTDKTIGTLPIDKLFPGTPYFCNVRTYSRNPNNQQDLFSETSAEFSTTTGLPVGVTGSNGNYTLGEGATFPYIFQGNTATGGETQPLPTPTCSTGRTVSFGGSGRTVSFGGSGRTVSFGGSGNVDVVVNTEGSDYSHSISLWTIPEGGNLSQGTEVACVPANNSAALSVTLPANQDFVVLIAGNYFTGGNLKATINLAANSNPTDSDGDGVSDSLDSCPNTDIGLSVNAAGCAENQRDTDNDGLNDDIDQCDFTPTGEPVFASGCSASEIDSDNDGLFDNVDQCDLTPAAEIAFIDANGCTPSQLDTDGDGVFNNVDQCPTTPPLLEAQTVNPQGCADFELDSDSDGVYNNLDQCPNTPAGQAVNPATGCALSQLDTDNDTVNDALDQCPTTPLEARPVNSVGCADSELDSDNDGVFNNVDQCLATPLEARPVNVVGCAASELDTDNDRINDALDLCPLTPPNAIVDNAGCAETQLDSDADGYNNAVDQCENTPEAERLLVDANGCGPSQRDTDGDTVNDNLDLCPNTVGGSANAQGCANYQLDDDGDGVYNNLDQCALTPANELPPNAVGCSISQRDTDNDTINDLVDLCPATPPLARPVNVSGCALSELDADIDGVYDDVDACPNTPAGSIVGATGCAPSELDDDGDNIFNDIDQCPETPAMTPVDAVGCPLPPPDDDADGISNTNDVCPLTPVGETPDANGCSISQRDTDGDGYLDNLDACLNTPSGAAVNQNGCALVEIDSDVDLINDAIDVCSGTPLGEPVNSVGCSASQIDTDSDTVKDNLDACPNTPLGVTVNANGCAIFQLDSDGDGVNDQLDLCPATTLGLVVDMNGCHASQLDTDSDGVNNSLDQCPSTVVGQAVNGVGCSAAQRDTDGDSVNDALDQCPNTPFGVTVNAVGCPTSGSTGSVTVINQSLSQNVALFRYSLKWTWFRLDNNASDPIYSDRITLSNLRPGNYRLSQHWLPWNWVTRQVSCVDATSSVFSFVYTSNGRELQSVPLNLRAGQHIVCTFTQDEFATLTVQKFIDTNANGTRDEGESRPNGWKFTLYQNGVQVGRPVTSSDGGRALFYRLLPGTYSLCETPKSGFIAQPCQTITLTSGQKPILYFANVRMP